MADIDSLNLDRHGQAPSPMAKNNPEMNGIFSPQVRSEETPENN
jgi:hypothetical protein